MSDFENDVMKSLGRIEQKVDTHTEQFKEMKREKEINEWKDWIKVVVMVPLITAFHAVLNRLGVKV